MYTISEIRIQDRSKPLDPPVAVGDFRNVMVLEELNRPGGITFQIPRDAKILEVVPGLLGRGNHVTVATSDDRTFVGFISERTREIVGEDGEPLFEVVADGALQWTDNAIIYPVTGAVAAQGTRYFNFSSEDGPWLDPSQWIPPIQVAPTNSSSTAPPFDGAPADWPNTGDFWLWDRNTLTSDAPEGEVYFRKKFTTTGAKTTYRVYGSVLNMARFYIDGAPVMTISEFGAHRKTFTADIDLGAGNHVFGIRAVVNEAGRGRGVVAMMARAQNLGEGENVPPESILFTTASAGWEMCAYPVDPPAWSIGLVLNTLFAEARQRGVEGLNGFGLDVSEIDAVVDSSGEPWMVNPEWAFDRGVKYREMLDQISQFGYDIWVEGRKLRIAAERGVDRTSGAEAVQFVKGLNITKSEVEASGEPIVNTLLANTSGGVYEYIDESGSVSKYGRREEWLSITSASVNTAAPRLVKQAFDRIANPIPHPTIEIAPEDPFLPWVNFDVGDWVLAPSDDDTAQSTKRRVVSIAGAGNETTGDLEYSIELDSIAVTANERYAKWLDRVEMGTLGGSMTAGSAGESALVMTPSVHIQPPKIDPSYRQTPAPPTGLEVSAEAYVDPVTGYAWGAVRLDWNAVTVDTEGAPCEVNQYEIWSRESSGGGTNWRSIGSVMNSSAVINQQPVGATMEYRVRAFATKSGLPSVPSATVSIVIPEDNVPPPAPSMPTFIGKLGVVIVGWNGRTVSNGLMPPDFLHVEVAAGTDAETTTVVGHMLSAGTFPIGDLPYDATLYVRLRAVDYSGNKSDWSAAAPGTIEKLVEVDLGQAIEGILADIESTADSALASADGKNTIYRGTATPAVPPAGFKVGDTWFDSTTGATVIKTWDGSGWVSQSIGAGGLADNAVTAEKIAQQVRDEITAARAAGDDAQVDADAAAQAAADAAAAASGALSAANSAAAQASDANTAALAAAGLAESKGEVIYQASAPTGVRANSANLWIRTSDNKPHTYDGSTWVAVTDKAATDAASAASSAQSAAASAATAAGAAQTTANNAATAAGAAAVAAGKAQSTADGKNTVYRGTATPAVPTGGHKTGDTWFDITGGTTVIKGWSGTAWVVLSLGTGAIAPNAISSDKIAAAVRDSITNAATAADDAQIAADAAADDALAASQAAAVADGKAESAASAAASAAADAATAAGIANGKGKVLVQSTAPVAADRNANTLWIDTTNGANTPKRWTTGTTWVAVTDKTATDAAAAAVAADGKAVAAAQAAAVADGKAVAADAKAVAAGAAAATAQTTADGKNTVYRGTTTPTAPTGGHKTGDTWFDITGGNTVIKSWSGTAWVVQALGTGGIAANAVSSDKIAQAVKDTITAAQTTGTNAAAAAAVADGKAVAAASAASDANAAALAASGLAGSKGEVIYQASAPTGTRASAANLWIRTSDNKPHTYNGTTWVAVTDKAATDAASAASGAQTTANSAASAASTAQTAANNAASAASTADAKAVAAATAANTAQGEATAARARANLAVSRGEIHDTRNDNEDPTYYWTNFAKQTRYEFKLAATMGAAGMGGTYTTLETTIPWTESSGGAITQILTSNYNGKTLTRKSIGNRPDATWSEWRDYVSEAQAAADAASAAATTAQTTADGKNTVYRGPTTPPVPTGGHKVGDAWFHTAANGDTVIKTWAGTAWTVQPLAAESIAANAITAVKIAADAVTAIKIAANSVTADKILAGSVVAEKLAADSVTADKILANAVTAGKIATDAVTANTIVANAVTTAKIATDAVTANKILAGSITAVKIDTDAVTAIKIAADAVTADKIVANAVTAVKIAAGAVTADKIEANAITAGKINAGAVTVGTIAANAVTTATIAADAVTAIKIAADAVTADKIIANAVSAVKIATGAVTADKILANAVTAGKIAADAVTADTIAADAVTAGKIAAGTITANDGVIASINADIISTGTLNSNRIASKSITADKVLIGYSENLFGDPKMLMSGVFPGYWSDTGGRSSGGGSVVFEATSAILDSTVSDMNRWGVPVEAGASYRVGAWVKLSVASFFSTGIQLRVQWRGASGTFGAAETVAMLPASAAANTWIWFEGVAVPPASAAYLALGFRKLGTYSTGTATFSEPMVSRMMTGELIVDGAITADKIMANAVTADKITANAVTTAKVDAGAITAVKIDANAVTADKIIANAITSKHTITGATIQTLSTTNRGIKIISGNLYAFNNVGNQTVFISGSTGAVDIVGDLTTGLGSNQVEVSASSSRGRPGIRMYTGFSDGHQPVLQSMGTGANDGFPAGSLLLLGSEVTTNSSGRADLVLKRGGDFELRQNWGTDSGVGVMTSGQYLDLRGRLSTGQNAIDLFVAGISSTWTNINPGASHEWTFTYGSPAKAGNRMPMLQLNTSGQLVNGVSAYNASGFTSRTTNIQTAGTPGYHVWYLSFNR